MSYFYVLAIAIFLAGCGGTYQKYHETLSLALAKPSDAYVTLEHVRSSPNDLLSVKNGNAAIAIVGLAFIDDIQTKWVSNDQVLLNFQHGRLVKTAGLPSDLLYISALERDPLVSRSKITSGTQWLSEYDFSTGKYGHQVQSIFSEHYADTIQQWGINFEVSCVNEHVEYGKRLNNPEYQKSLVNVFCFDLATDTLVKSIQQLPYANEAFEFVYLSRLARLRKS